MPFFETRAPTDPAAGHSGHGLLNSVSWQESPAPPWLGNSLRSRSWLTYLETPGQGHIGVRSSGASGRGCRRKFGNPLHTCWSGRHSRFSLRV